MITKRYFVSVSDPSIKCILNELKFMGITYGIQSLFEDCPGFELTIREPKGKEKRSKLAAIHKMLEL